jgi:hypothetical protein
MPEWLVGSKYLLYPNSGSEVIVIDGLKELIALHDIFPFDPYGNTYHMKWLDFEKISKYAEGISLTSVGQWETRLSEPINLYGWDCESTLWFRNVFTKIEKIK